MPGLRNGIQIPDDDRINNFSRYNVTASTSLMWMNASEVAFLRAEGALRGWAMGGNAGPSTRRVSGSRSSVAASRIS